MPMPPGYAIAATRRKKPAPNAASAHSGLGSSTVCATRTMPAAGRTTTLGMIRCERSIAETVTRTAQKKAATKASAAEAEGEEAPRNEQGCEELDGRIDESDPRPAGTAASTEHDVRDERHVVVPRQSPCPHSMHAEPGATIERCSGTRAATTFRKLPSASAGASTSGGGSAVNSLSRRAVEGRGGARPHLGRICVAHDDRDELDRRPAATVCQVMYVSTRYKRPSAPVRVCAGTSFVHGDEPHGGRLTRSSRSTGTPCRSSTTRRPRARGCRAARSTRSGSRGSSPSPGRRARTAVVTVARARGGGSRTRTSRRGQDPDHEHGHRGEQLDEAETARWSPGEPQPPVWRRTLL